MSTEKLQVLKRELSAKYNLDFDKELLPLMIELQETRQTVDQSLQSAISHLEKAAGKVNASQKTFQFTSDSQAFWHGFGKWGITGVIVAILGFVAYFLEFTLQQQQIKAQQLRAFLKDHENIQAFSTLAASSTLEKTDFKQNQIQYLKLYPVANFFQAEIGKHAIVDPFCKCIIIPVNYLIKGEKMNR